MNKLLEKLIAVLLVITLAGVNFITLGIYSVTYALSDSEIAGQTTTTQNKNVEFDAYLGEGGHIVTANAESKEMKMYLNIKVKNAGYLKDAQVAFKDVNFKIGNIANENVEKVDAANNVIILKQINNGSDVTIEIPITMLNEENIPVDNFSKESKTIFSGTYIDGEGKDRQVSKEIVNRISWESEAEVSLSTEMTKYIPYAKDNVYGVMVQTKVNSGIVDSKLPIKETNLNITVPEIDGIKPSKVTVIANKTKATNGEEDGLNFTSENYSYNPETGIVTISVKNEADENRQISWSKNSQDEYIVTFIYEGQEIYNKANTNGINSKVGVVAKVATYDDKLTVIEKTLEHEVKATEKVGTIADFSIYTTKEIAKGYIYANYNASSKTETSYIEKYSSTVTLLELTDEIEFVQSHDKFLTDDGKQGSTTVSNNNYVYNKKVKINEKVFKKILGEEGSINLLNSEGTTLGTINKDTEKDSQGNYVLDISLLNNNALTIKTSKPVSVGTITLEIEKAIKGTIDYSADQMRAFTKIKAEVVGKAATSTVTASQEILLKEVKSVAGLEISKKDLTTVVKNENVEIRAILDTSSIYNALYTNPTLKIRLPSYIEKIDIKNINILMDGGLKVKKVTPVLENDAYVIDIELEGTQTEYTIDAEYKGIIVILNTDISVKTLTPSNKNKITMTYTNANPYATSSKARSTSEVVETEVNFVAPTGVVAANGIKNYAEEGSDILSISDQSQTGIISAYAEKKVATVYGKVINNYSNKIGNLVILGRIPVEGNKNIDTGVALNSTFSTTMNSTLQLTGIDSSKYVVYYSDNIDATNDLTNQENGWDTTAKTTSKSYMIVVSNHEIEAGETIEFSYNIEIPENIKHNNSAYQMYKIYYNNISSIGTMPETKVSPVVGIATEKGPELEAILSSTISTVKEGQIVKMKVTVNNTGSVVAENVNVNIPLPKYAKFVSNTTGTGYREEDTETKVISIGTIEAGKSYTAEYHIKLDDYTFEELTEEEVGNLTEEELDKQEEIAYNKNYPKDIVNKVFITTDKLSTQIPSNEYTIKLLDGKLKLDIYNDSSDSTAITVSKGDIIDLTINVTNITFAEDVSNVEVTIPLPDGVKYKEAVIKESWSSTEEITEGITYDEASKIIKFSLGTLEYEKLIRLQLEVEEFEGNITILAKAQAEGIEEHYSNVLEYVAENILLEVSELTSTPKYVKEGDFVTYKLKITNKGNAIAKNIRVTDILPSELIFEKAVYTYQGNDTTITTTKNGRIEIPVNSLLIGESAEIQIIGQAKLLSDKNDKEIQNKVTITANNYEGTETNTVINIIEYYEEIHKDDVDEEEPGVDNPPEEKRYKITGTAWVDSNKNGKRDSEEGILPDVSVILIYKNNNTIVRDPDTNEEKRTITESNGKYEFNNLPQGEYIVIFLYDAARYSITEYRSQGVDESLNSDAVTINVTLDGKRRVAGTSDAITISDDNVRDIDIGLYSAEKFDLKIDKYISKITLTTPTIGTTTYTYDNSKAAKIEVLPQNLGKSNIAIEYKIVVTNEGAIAGYAKKIVDYLPEGLGFTTELNKDWYLSDNGNVYNASLENTLIQPGESKELTLIVTRKITEDSLDVINNNAEIYESYNEQGISDIDSIAGNNANDEDDISEADIALSIVTGGEIITYVTVIIGVMTILGFGIYEIKKRVLKKRNI